jgi:hypothetical protein
LFLDSKQGDKIMANANIEAAESYVIGLGKKDLSQVPLADDVIFKGPLTDEPLHGASALQEFLAGIFPLVKETRIQRSFADGEQVCILWEFELSEPPVVIPICEYFHVSNGKLQEVRPFYDPRPLTNPA